MGKRIHHHGPYGNQTVRNVYMQIPTGSVFKWKIAGQWCPICGFKQSELLAQRQLEVLGV